MVGKIVLGSSESHRNIFANTFLVSSFVLEPLFEDFQLKYGDSEVKSCALEK